MGFEWDSEAVCCNRSIPWKLNKHKRESILTFFVTRDSFCQLFLFLIKPIWKQHQNFQTRNANLLTMLLSGAFVRKCAFVGDLGGTVGSPLLKPSISSVSPRNIERQLRRAYTDDTFNWKSVFETGTFGIGGVCETLV